MSLKFHLFLYCSSLYHLQYLCHPNRQFWTRRQLMHPYRILHAHLKISWKVWNPTGCRMGLRRNQWIEICLHHWSDVDTHRNESVVHSIQQWFLMSLGAKKNRLYAQMVGIGNLVPGNRSPDEVVQVFRCWLVFQWLQCGHHRSRSG